jgi:mono/diheme cytochrome c family protein
MKQLCKPAFGPWIKIATLASAIALVTALPGRTENVEAGLALAEQWCNACHSIGTDEPRQEDAGPIWSEIAEKHAEDLRSALDTPHDFMPSFPSLNDGDKANLVAYIKSLE